MQSAAKRFSFAEYTIGECGGMDLFKVNAVVLPQAATVQHIGGKGHDSESSGANGLAETLPAEKCALFLCFAANAFAGIRIIAGNADDRRLCTYVL